MAAKAGFVESILHPTDFSAASERAFAHALGLALVGRCALTILHVGGAEEDANVKWTRFPAVRRLLERWGLLRAGSLKSEVFERLGVSVEKVWLRSRRPAAAVSDYVELEPADLIVLATEGRDGRSQWINPSIAEGISRRSPTLSLFVPAAAARDLVSPDDGRINLHRVLLPVDRSPAPDAAAALARRAAEILGDGDVVITELHVGEAVPQPAKPVAGSGWMWQSERGQGDVVEAILAAAEDRPTDLLVMATAGRDGVRDVLLGSTTEQVLRRAPCPLLAVPAGLILR